MILLPECPGCLRISKRQESCSGRRLSSATPPQLLHCSPSPGWTLLAPAKRELHPLSPVKQPFCTGSLHQWESPKFLRPYPKEALLEESSQHLPWMLPQACPSSQHCHSSEHQREGTGPALLAGIHTPSRGGGSDGDCSEGLWLCCSQSTPAPGLSSAPQPAAPHLQGRVQHLGSLLLFHK